MITDLINVSTMSSWEATVPFGSHELPKTDLVRELAAMLERAEPALTPECCIYRVPHDIRILNEEAYTPKVISIGPYHHGKKRLQNMERHKLRFFETFLERSDANLDDFVHCVQDLEPTVRCSYDEIVELDRDEFVKIVLVDSGFIIELFWRYYFNDGNSNDNDPILLKPWLTTNLRLDLILLENQVPFLVLEKLFHLAFASRLRQGMKFPSLLGLTFHYFEFHNKMHFAPDEEVNLRHFNDLLRTFHLPPPNRLPPRKDGTVIHLQYSLTELSEAGMKFRPAGTSNCLLDFKYYRGVLEIPRLKVEDSTEVLFRNLVALEQCHYPFDTYITDFVALLDFLINTGNDVDLLVHKGIFVNWLGDSQSVANLFNQLWKNVTQVNMNSHYLHMCEEMNEFYDDPWRKRKATLKRDYFNTPWKTAASTAGIILLILSLVQSVFAVLQVYKSS